MLGTGMLLYRKIRSEKATSHMIVMTVIAERSWKDKRNNKKGNTRQETKVIFLSFHWQSESVCFGKGLGFNGKELLQVIAMTHVEVCQLFDCRLDIRHWPCVANN